MLLFGSTRSRYVLQHRLPISQGASAIVVSPEGDILTIGGTSFAVYSNSPFIDRVHSGKSGIDMIDLRSRWPLAIPPFSVDKFGSVSALQWLQEEERTFLLIGTLNGYLLVWHCFLRVSHLSPSGMI